MLPSLSLLSVTKQNSQNVSVYWQQEGYTTRQLLCQAALHAKTSGTASHWNFLDVLQIEEKDEATG
jgi:hypothetical protein